MSSSLLNKCPICGAQGIKIDDEGKYHCEHCNADFSNIDTKKVLHTKHIINEAKIKKQDVKMYDAKTRRIATWLGTFISQDREIFLWFLLLVMGSLIGGIIALVNSQITTSFKAPEASFRGKDYEIVENLAQDAGFKHIEVQAVEDLNSVFLDDRNYGKVIHVYIDGVTDFDKSAYFNKNATVRITYHTDGRDHKTVFPYSNNDFRGKDPATVKKMLADSGFPSVEMKQLMDAKRDWFGNDNKNKVENVFIDGVNNYRKNQLIENNAIIVIEYHDRVD